MEREKPGLKEGLPQSNRAWPSITKMDLINCTICGCGFPDQRSLNSHISNSHLRKNDDNEENDAALLFMTNLTQNDQKKRKWRTSKSNTASNSND